MEAGSPGLEFAGEACPQGEDAAWLMRTLKACAALLPQPVDRATVQFVRDPAMQALHTRWSNDPSTTDVLTFALNQPGQPVDCDVAICVDEAERRSAELGHPVRLELLLYALHALLHACGYDDRTPADHAAMHAMEDRILTQVGVGAVFAPRGPAGGGAPTDGGAS